MVPSPDSLPHSPLAARKLRGLFVFLVASALSGLVLGPSGWHFSGGIDRAVPATQILLELRLPRVVLALVIGAALAQAGVALQALFRNPLADVTLTGVSAGAALGAGGWLLLAPLGVIAATSTLTLPLAAALGACASTLLVLRAANRDGLTDLPSLLLAGLALNALAGAGIALMQALASDRSLRDLTSWLYGNLGRAGWSELAFTIPPLLLACLLLLRSSRPLDVLLLGEPAAQAAGLAVEPLKRQLLLAVVLIAAITVALAGMIGFVGLVVPHLLRKWLGSPAHEILMPAAALLGAGLLCLADTLARTVATPIEIPVGVVMAFVGVPVFLVLIRRLRETDFS